MSTISHELTEVSVKPLIDRYMTSCQTFDRDFRQLTEFMAKNTDKDIIEFRHELDMNSVIHSSDNYDFSEYLLRNERLFSQIFGKRLNRKINKTVLNGRKVWFCLKYKNLPQNHHLKTLSDLQSSDANLLSLDSIRVVSMSATFKTLMASKYVAVSDRDCDEVIKWKVRSIHETDSDFENKSRRYVESKADRKYGRKRNVLAVVGPKSGLNPIAVTIHYSVFSDEELAFIYNGSQLNSVVLLKIDVLKYLMLSFDKISPIIPLDIDLNHEINRFVHRFPNQIQLLFEDRKESKFSFALTMAYIFGDNICISGSFFRLKLGLLLSVLSTNEYRKRNHSSVLVICDDTLIIRRLFEWTSLFCPNHYHQKSTMLSMAGSTRHKSALEWIDSGVLHLGADGVTVITTACSLNELPEKDKTSLFHALETNEVIARQSQPSVDAIAEVELKSTVWAVIENDIEEKKCKQNSKKQTILWTEVFSMVYVVEEPEDNYHYELTTEFELDFNEWQQTLELMNRIRPQMTQTAEELLQHYYVANRQIRGSKLNAFSMESLVSLSKAFAKLSLRPNVTKYEALMAIHLFEESLSTRFPQFMSPLFVEPISHVKEEDKPSVLGPECENYMKEFEQRLYEFINSANIKTNDGFKGEENVVNEE